MMKLASMMIAALAGSALAQPAPPQPTPPPPPAEPSPPPTPVEASSVETPPPEPERVKAPEPKPPEPKKPDPGPGKLPIGKGGQGFFQPGMLAQGWSLFERGNDVSTSTFRLRRAELSAKGEILPKQVSYSVMIDPAKVREFGTVTVAGPPDAMGNPTTVTIRQPGTAVSVLQDFYITFLSPWLEVSLGQFKIPVSWEGYNSSGKLLFPERAFVSSAFGDKRDLGMRLTKTFPKWGYSAGVFNGAGLNNLDNNNQKDAALRLEVYPIKGLTLAGVTYDSIGYRRRAGTKDRWEADLRYEAGPYLIQAEYLRARDVAKDREDPITAQGYYVAAGYTFKKAPLPLAGDLQPVVRFGFLDPDTAQNLPGTGASADELYHYDVGLNYYLRAHEMKLQASYQRQQFDNKPANNQVIVAAQVSY